MNNFNIPNIITRLCIVVGMWSAAIACIASLPEKSDNDLLAVALVIAAILVMFWGFVFPAPLSIYKDGGK